MVAATAEIDIINLDVYRVNQPPQVYYAPEQLLEVPYFRPPESEIYGRSLSTIRRLGAFMINKSQAEAVSSPEASQAKAEFYTSVEEGFGTDMELGGGLEVRDFDSRPIIGGRVMAKDLKTAVSTMTDSGLKCAQKTAEQDSRFLPQLTRSVWDHENALIVDKMARGETEYNTRIVVSPFPEEAAVKSGEEYWRGIGYVPHLKRGFVQLYHFNGSEIVTGSLSFDGSNKQQLKELFEQLEIPIPPGEITDNWLQYAKTGNFTEDKAKSLATSIADQAGDPKFKKNTNTVDVTHKYRFAMESAFNESYIHVCESLVRGYQTDEAKGLIDQFADKAQHFNKRYAEALYRMKTNKNKFTDDDSVVLHELLVYSTIEVMRALHLRGKTISHNLAGTSHDYHQLYDVQLHSVNPQSFQNLLCISGAEGAKNGRTYSACGLKISPGDDNKAFRPEAVPDSPQTIFGGIEKEEADKRLKPGEDDLGPTEFKCKYGHWNKRRKNTLITQCRIRTCKDSVGCK